MGACSLGAASTPSGLRRYAARLKTLARFVEQWLAPDGPSLLNEKRLHEGGVFRLYGGPCWIRTSDQLVKSRPANFQVIDLI